MLADADENENVEAAKRPVGVTCSRPAGGQEIAEGNLIPRTNAPTIVGVFAFGSEPSLLG